MITGWAALTLNAISVHPCHCLNTVKALASVRHGPAVMTAACTAGSIQQHAWVVTRNLQSALTAIRPSMLTGGSELYTDLQLMPPQVCLATAQQHRYVVWLQLQGSLAHLHHGMWIDRALYTLHAKRRACL
jgi:hypothetical protein